MENLSFPFITISFQAFYESKVTQRGIFTLSIVVIIFRNFFGFYKGLPIVLNKNSCMDRSKTGIKLLSLLEI